MVVVGEVLAELWSVEAKSGIFKVVHIFVASEGLRLTASSSAFRCRDSRDIDQRIEKLMSFS